jgi:hypothetical protein
MARRPEKLQGFIESSPAKCRMEVDWAVARSSVHTAARASHEKIDTTNARKERIERRCGKSARARTERKKRRSEREDRGA